MTRNSPRRRLHGRKLLFAAALLVALLIAERAREWVDLEGGAEIDAGIAAAGMPADAVGPCRVRKVVDGDTARLRCDGEEVKVRLLRVDTPERDEPGYGEATRALRDLLSDRDVYLAYEEPGIPERGSYGRLLVYLFADGKNVNVEMVRAGWSPFDTRWGDGRFERAFREAEREGRL